MKVEFNFVSRCPEGITFCAFFIFRFFFLYDLSARQIKEKMKS